jgi:hypothetical protein
VPLLRASSGGRVARPAHLALFKLSDDAGTRWELTWKQISDI